MSNNSGQINDSAQVAELVERVTHLTSTHNGRSCREIKNSIHEGIYALITARHGMTVPMDQINDLYELYRFIDDIETLNLS